MDADVGRQGERPARRVRRKYMGKLDGKIGLITGGTSGIGLATAKRFVHEGAYVFITGRRDPELAAAVKEVGSNVAGVRGDVSNLGDLDRLFAHIGREKGTLDIVFANAGVAKYAPLGTLTEELYDSIFDINVKGLLFTLMSKIESYSSSVSVPSGAYFATPAFANTMSSVPFSRPMCAKRRSRSPRFDTSPRTPATLLPTSLTAAANSGSR